MDFNIDRGSMLKLCHERILDYALRREGQRDDRRYYIGTKSDRP